MEVKLFRFSLPTTSDALYLYSLRDDETYLRRAFEEQDHGGLEFDVYQRLYEQGKIERVIGMEHVPEEYHDCIPYNTWELDPNGFSPTIKDFFDPKYKLS